MKVRELINVLALYQGEVADDLEITAIEQDSRRVKPGALFICIDGEVVDGHDFAQKAEELGASLIIAEKPVPVTVPTLLVRDSKRAMAQLADAFYDHPSQKLKLIGVTGTNGKTTVTHLIEKVLADHDEKTGLIGTMYRKIGDQILETINTTPDSLTLQKTFDEMVKKEVTSAVMEVSSHALVQGRVYGCDYDVAVFTNLSQDHLDYHHTMEEYAHAKSLLFAQLGNRYSQSALKYAVLNADDPVSTLMQKATAAPILTYGIDQDADFRAQNIQVRSTGSTFELVTPFGSEQVTIKMVGKFSIYNMLAALTACFALGVPYSQAVKSLGEVAGVSGRFELVHAGQDFPVIVDYSHTPDGLLNVLETIDEFAERRVFCVVGCGGDRDKGKRPQMAKIAVQYATDPVFTSDNPRTEDPEAIIQDMLAGVTGADYVVKVDRREAIEYAVSQAVSGDVILIAGKGHEDYQIIGTTKINFDDRVVAREAIEKKQQLD
ncbi:UDP-N-acetylmuramoyl-L-alanyl-D-glutamate--2,6-diaminopimelate ligase [Listeria ilorinensis]|uniref:UDP-N-acetylmuramoyl-L-alanyl-D-glutamate--2, 6-diaminopimelate ligase n=1 Tax=Listeria ilorinensis TaxID=2867439 RepID=UPI001EF4D504|nr:UDP-N-acetylmuramoyl-L-alanyl-D-glutamate--2,6-diaminopimelate ligase [Listeria ilorinensis]